MSAAAGLGQARVFLREELSKGGKDSLMKQYGGRISEKDRAGLAEKIHKSLEPLIGLKLTKGVIIEFNVMVDGKGKVENVILDFMTMSGQKDLRFVYLKDSIAMVLSDYKAQNLELCPFGYYEIVGMGPPDPAPRKVKKGDSTLTELEQAIVCMDTLRIKRLYLNQLELTAVPDVIYRYPNLEELYLGGNALTSVTMDLRRLPRLWSLHLEGNKLTKDQVQLTANKTLKMINLNENQLTDIPSNLRHSRGVKTVWLAGNKLTGLSPRGLRSIRNVQDLNLYKTSLSSLPSRIGKLRKLEILDLYHNQLRELPASVTRLKRLTHLAVSYNELEALPKRMDRLKKLHTLYTHHNQLRELPLLLAKTSAIRILHIGYNQFTAFPSQIAALKELRELDITHNQLAYFPDQLLDLPALERVYLDGNPFARQDDTQSYANQLERLKGKHVEVY